MSSKSSFYNNSGVTNTQSNAIDASVDNAEASATASENSANNASASASTATTKASEASTSASTATTKASEASTSASTATTKASEASTSATTATTKATESATSATASANSATAASTSASTATTKASEASSSASTALSHKNDAQTAKTAAETAETNAETAETNAASSATAASTSASSASTSASTATTKAGEAATSASTATTKANEAATSASNASTAATTATTKASEASASASSAASSATAASASKDAALAALDSFDDRYLGVKSSNPTVDNDGNALVAGSLYFNSTDDTMKVYEGSTWVAAYASLSGALIAASNLSDLSNVATARTNLGLGTAATTAASAYATAAQGTKADNALPKAGGTLTGDLSFGDNDKAIFGDGDDLKMYHNGVNSYINNTTGDLYIRDSGGDIIIEAKNNETSALFNNDGSVELYYDNAKKFETTSTGIDVTGTVTADGLTVDGDGKITTSSGIGLQLHNSSSNQSYLQFTNSATGESSANGFQIGIDGSEEGLIWHYKNEPIKFATNNTEAMRIDSSGRVGIGTSSPSTQLEVKGSTYSLIRVNGGNTNNSGIDFGDTDDVDIGRIRYDNSSDAMQFWTNNAERMRINSSGNVGIGCVPSSIQSNFDTLQIGGNLTLNVDSTGANAGVYMGNNVYRDSTNSRWEYIYTDEASQYYQANGNHVWRTASSGSANAAISWSERMRIEPDGRVGIGTSSPSVELSIAGTDPQLVLWEGADGASSSKVQLGTGTAQGFINVHKGNGTRTVQINSDGDSYFNGGNVGIGTSSPRSSLDIDGGVDTHIRMQTNNTGTSSSDGLLLGLDGSTNALAYFWNYENAPVVIGTNNTERMRIDSSGNVGIGISPVTPLDVVTGSNQRLFFTQTNGSPIISAVNKANTAYTPLQLNGSDVRLQVSGTERMRIDSSGNLLVGRTAEGDGNVGHTFRADGFSQTTRSGGLVADFNRLSSDGDILRFQKDGTSVGTIGVQGTNDLTLHSTTTGHKGLRLGQGYYIPTNNSGSPEDNSVDIGMTSYRYKDVHAVNYYGNGSNLTGVGGSTTFGAVGTYIWGRPANTTDYSNNDTASGLKAITNVVGAYGGVGLYEGSSWTQTNEETSMSGTWRHMGGAGSNGYRAQPGIWVRIS